MAIMNVSLPDQMKQYIEERVHEGGYNTTSEYIRNLIREDQKRADEEKLEALLLKGLHSPGSVWSSDDIDHIKAAVRDRLAAKRQDS